MNALAEGDFVKTMDRMTRTLGVAGGSPGSRQRGSLRVLLGAVALLGALILTGWAVKTDSARAKAEVFSYTSEPTTTQAGAHPDIVTTFVIGNRTNQAPTECYCNDPKDVILHAPPGVTANPHVLSTCSVANLALFNCPSDTQAGVVVLSVFDNWAIFPLFRMPTQKGQAGLLGFTLPFGFAIPIYISFNARTGSDYGLDVKTLGISHALPLLFYGPIFWGVPGDPVNDVLRFPPNEGAYQEISCGGNPVALLASKDNAAIGGLCNLPTGVPSSLPIAPFTQNPTTCAGPLISSIDTVAYDLETDHAEAPWPETTGCDALSFDPSLAANPTTSQADTASGLEVDLRVPLYQDPNTPTPSELRETEITMPEGFSINPNAADGKTVCTDGEARIGTELPAECPEHSKVGTAVIDSSALPAPIDGYVYLGEQKPGDPYRIIVTANGFGTAIKLLGSVRPDSDTGRIVTVFEDLPQAPVQRTVLHFFGSERGLLATPEKCATYAVESSFTPWADELSPQNATQFFVIDSGPGGSPCPGATRPFEPGFEAGASDNTGGSHTSFALRVTRADGDQNLAGVNVEMPRGFSASLRGIPYCPQSAIDLLNSPEYTGNQERTASACPAASQIGTATGGAGAGTHPVHVDGRVFLAGPYKGAPLSLVVVLPAVSGPYDLGNIAVRAAVHVDPVSAQVTAITDPLPQIFEGIPLRARLIQVDLNRPNFALNPTNCSPFSINASVFGDEGGVTDRAAAFQVANCADLEYAPKLGIRLRGGLRRGGHPAIRGVLRAGLGEANSRRVSVLLPKGELLDNSHIRTICTRRDFASESCPPDSRIGRATVKTRLLDDPLTGAVYLRSSSRRLPDLVMDLRGQLDLEIVARVDSVRGRLRTTFEGAPDAPVDKVVLNLAGGKKGLLINSESLCGKRKRATVKMSGHNGRARSGRVRLQTNCSSRASRHRHRSRLFDARAVG